MTLVYNRREDVRRIRDILLPDHVPRSISVTSMPSKRMSMTALQKTSESMDLD